MNYRKVFSELLIYHEFIFITIEKQHSSPVDINGILTFLRLSRRNSSAYQLNPHEWKMMMAQAPATAHPFLHPEYSVYIYHLPENHLDGQSDWERRSVFADPAAAMNEAYRLFKSQNFKKVEVKQRQHNPYTRSVKARTVKVFDLKPSKKAAQYWLVAFCVVLGVCIAGYWF